MNPSLLYRVAAVLLVLFAAGHQYGFRQVDPAWGMDATVSAMKTIEFQIQGVTRNYWGFYSGFGFFVTVLLLFSAILAWQLGGLPADTLRSIPLLTWAFAATFVVITLMTWRYFFPAPLVFSVLVTLCLILAAWRANAAPH
jgi:hypothetical protein